MNLYIRLHNGKKMQIYEYSMTTSGFCAKFINTNLLDAKNFFGKEIIDSIDIIDEDKTVIESFDIHMKYQRLIVENTTILTNEYRITQDAYEESIYDADGETILEVIQHPEEGEYVEKKQDAEIVQVFLVKPSIEDEIATIKNVVGIVNIATLPLPELKEYQIKQSKLLLERYILEHPLISKCHNNAEATYNITSEKQMLMLMNVYKYETALKKRPEDAKLTWNETGELCEEWTLDEFQNLIDEAGQVIEPLVAAQQTYEIEIMSMTSVSQLLDINFNYAEADIRNAK